MKHWQVSLPGGVAARLFVDVLLNRAAADCSSLLMLMRLLCLIFLGFLFVYCKCVFWFLIAILVILVII
jgi:hypothetical protein